MPHTTCPGRPLCTGLTRVQPRLQQPRPALPRSASRAGPQLGGPQTLPMWPPRRPPGSEGVHPGRARHAASGVGRTSLLPRSPQRSRETADPQPSCGACRVGGSVAAYVGISSLQWGAAVHTLAARACVHTCVCTRAWTEGRGGTGGAGVRQHLLVDKPALLLSPSGLCALDPHRHPWAGALGTACFQTGRGHMACPRPRSWRGRTSRAGFPPEHLLALSMVFCEQREVGPRRAWTWGCSPRGNKCSPRGCVREHPKGSVKFSLQQLGSEESSGKEVKAVLLGDPGRRQGPGEQGGLGGVHRWAPCAPSPLPLGLALPKEAPEPGLAAGVCPPTQFPDPGPPMSSPSWCGTARRGCCSWAPWAPPPSCPTPSAWWTTAGPALPP